MIPQHSGAFYRKQRFVELYNVGTSTIPAYGACEIVGSSRPEKVGGITPDGGATILHVRLSETDNPCNHVINGHCPIPAGQRGKPGTKDSPMLALVYAEYPSGTGIGIKTGSYFLEEGYCGYVVDGDYDVSSGTQRVTRYDNCPNEMIVRAIECVMIGDSHEAQPQKWDDDSEAYVDDVSRGTVTVIDPLCWRIAMPGDKYKVHRENCSSNKWRPIMPFGLTRRVLIENEIDCNETGLVRVLSNQGEYSGYGESCEWTDSEYDECELLVCNTSNRPLACDAVEYGTVHFAPGECIGWIVPDPRAMEAIAELVNGAPGTSPAIGMCNSSSLPNIEINNLNVTDVCEWPFRTTPDRVKNPLGLLACVGDDKLILGWDASDCEWYVKQVEVHVDTFITDLSCSGCGMLADTMEIGFQSCCPTSEDPEFGRKHLEGLIFDGPASLKLSISRDAC